ncbi:MAG: SH3 domain-containing protein [Candidatus Binatia bacterium]
MVVQSTMRTRLCPNCANSIDEDAANCRYCKAELVSDYVPEWLKRDKSLSEPHSDLNGKKKFPIPAKFIWPAALLVVALIAFFAGGYRQRNELLLSSQANLKQLQAKDQIIQSQAAQLSETGRQLKDNSNQVAELKIKLEEIQKEHSAARQRLAAVSREADRANSTRSAEVRRTAARAPNTAPAYPQPVATRRSTDPGVYEITQATSVYEAPSQGARVLTQIVRGTRINVVNSAGDWLEVRSKHGNPPGYVRSNDARQLARAN